MTDPTDRRLNVLYVLRAPVGGLFRHVVDLARGVAARGHRVGLIADATTGGAQAEATLAALAPELELGLSRVAMSRQIGPRDLTALAHVARRVAEVEADVVHGHGAKGGAYARLAAARRALRVYTPHGGSLHYRWGSPTGAVYLALERALLRRTDLFLFESAYGRDVFRAKVGDPGAAARVVHNGVTEAEFSPIAPDPQATDLVFIGELRALKGIDVLIKAIALLAKGGQRVTATIVGDGPDRAALQAQAAALELAAQVRFVGAKPARAGFALGRLLVVPSRAESLPYIVLEAAAAAVAHIATRVGGIPEIFEPNAADLVAPGDPAALADAIRAALQNPTAMCEATLRLQARVRAGFSADAMAQAVLAGYADAFVRRDS
ncbi:MAG: glycosyltransferase family 4 protein [Xanthobacteraceae bacterium]